MPEKRRTYDDEFKRDAVRLVTHKSYGVSETARRLGISAKLLGRWKREAEASANGAVNGHGHVSPESDALRRLRKENQRLRMERDILKKRSSSLRTHRAETCLYRGASGSVANLDSL